MPFYFRVSTQNPPTLLEPTKTDPYTDCLFRCYGPGSANLRMPRDWYQRKLSSTLLASGATRAVHGCPMSTRIDHLYSPGGIRHIASSHTNLNHTWTPYYENNAATKLSRHVKQLSRPQWLGAATLRNVLPLNFLHTGLNQAACRPRLGRHHFR